MTHDANDAPSPRAYPMGTWSLAIAIGAPVVGAIPAVMGRCFGWLEIAAPLAAAVLFYIAISQAEFVW